MRNLPIMAKRPRPSTVRRPDPVISAAAANRHGSIARKKCQLEGGLLVTLASAHFRSNGLLRAGFTGFLKHRKR
jgi:hypothetical protein